MFDDVIAKLPKPRLLDLFCGAKLPYNRISAIIKAWLQSLATIAERFLNHNGKLVNIAQWAVRIILLGQQKRRVYVTNVVNHSLLKVPLMPIDNIVLRHVPRKASKKARCCFANNIQVIKQKLTKDASLNIPTCGSVKAVMNGLNLSVYWGANV